jgi:hypothetical protein
MEELKMIEEINKILNGTQIDDEINYIIDERGSIKIYFGHLFVLIGDLKKTSINNIDDVARELFYKSEFYDKYLKNYYNKV